MLPFFVPFRDYLHMKNTFYILANSLTVLYIFRPIQGGRGRARAQGSGGCYRRQRGIIFPLNP
nr:MAG TPA: hypothetical protein [Caudoviricetes sp.]DAX28882.1 MAG TPA: hypothetical protein [Caudoviricetes sp.]